MTMMTASSSALMAVVTERLDELNARLGAAQTPTRSSAELGSLGGKANSRSAAEGANYAGSGDARGSTQLK